MAAYKIVGADQKEYGPVTEEQIRQWIADGRANAQTRAKLEDGPWQALSNFPEFTAALGPAEPAVSPPPPGTSMPPLTTMPPLPTGGVSGTNAPSTNGLAIAGLVCSILGLSCGFVPCCLPIFSTLGLILSAIALSQINQDPMKYSGRGVAMAGIIIALIGYALLAIFFFTGLLSRTFRPFHRRFRHFV